MKKLYYLILILILLTGGTVGAGWAFASDLFRSGIEKAAGYALDVDVKLGGVRLNPLKNEIEVVDMVIGNPEGFQTRSAFQIHRATIHADLRSFLTDEPTIHLIELDRPKVTLERGLRTSNLKELINNASRLQSASDRTPADDGAPDAAKKKLRIEKVLIEGTEVALSAPILRGQELVVPLRRIELNDVGKERERVASAELFRVVIDRILTQTLVDGGDIIPSAFGSIEQPVGDAVGGVTDALGGATDGLRGLLGR